MFDDIESLNKWQQCKLYSLVLLIYIYSQQVGHSVGNKSNALRNFFLICGTIDSKLFNPHELIGMNCRE